VNVLVVVGQIALLRKHGTPPCRMSTKVQEKFEIYTFEIYTFIRARPAQARARAGAGAGAGKRVRVRVASAGPGAGPGAGENGSHLQGRGQLLRNTQACRRMVASPFAGCIVC